MWRQGDVLIVQVEKKPDTATQHPRCVLALGEVTGHAHQILDGAMLWVDSDGTKYVEVYGEEATVTHEEHGHIALTGPAIYRVVQQREYTPQEIRNVAD